MSSSIEQELLKAKKDARYTAYVCIFALAVNGFLFYLDINNQFQEGKLEVFEESNLIRNISYICGFVFLGILIYFSWVKSSRFSNVIAAIFFFVLSLALILLFFLAMSGPNPDSIPNTPRPFPEVDYSEITIPILIQLLFYFILGYCLYKGVRGSFRYHSINKLINK